MVESRGSTEVSPAYRRRVNASNSFALYAVIPRVNSRRGLKTMAQQLGDHHRMGQIVLHFRDCRRRIMGQVDRLAAITPLAEWDRISIQMRR